MFSTSDTWDEPIYAIGVAAEMVSLHPQTLRRYEQLGLLVSRLSQELGLNMAGVEVILRLNTRIRELQAELDNLIAIRVGLEAQVAALEERLMQIGL
jgi:MerR family transcriptional regulator/heat shock protein HspR